MRRISWLAGFLGVMIFTSAARAQGDGPKEVKSKEVQEVLAKGLAFLKTQQSPDGSFSAKRTGPGVTALVVAALLRNGVSPREPVVVKAMEFLKKNRIEPIERKR